MAGNTEIEWTEPTEAAWMNNRQKRRQPRTKRKFWCGCDMYLIHEGEKCPVCGNRERIPKRNKR